MVGFVAFSKGGDASPKASGGPSMMSAAMARDTYENDDYSDIDSLSSSEEQVSQTINDAPQNNVDKQYQKYGIGAQLLMKMGFQQGKGLGANGEGIANPIETQLQPRGMGVGGASEQNIKTPRDHGRKQQRIDLKSPFPNLYLLLKHVQKLPVEIPNYYVDLSNRLADARTAVLDEQTHTELLEEARTAFKRLSEFRDSFVNLESQKSYLEYKLEETRHLLDANDEESAENVLAILGTFKGHERSAVDVSALVNVIVKMVDQLVNQCLDYTRLDEIYIAMTSLVVPKILEEYFEGKIADLQSLSLLASGFRRIASKKDDFEEDDLCLWDAHVAVQLKPYIEKALDPESEDITGEALDLALLGNSFAIFIDDEIAKGYIRSEMVFPILSRYIVDRWEPDSASQIDISDYLLRQFVTFDAFDDPQLPALVESVLKKYLSIFRTSLSKSIWKAEPKNAMEILQLLNIKFLSDFTSIEGLQNQILLGILDFMQGLLWNDPLTYGKLDIVFDLLMINGLFEETTIIVLLEFTVFNPWMLYISNHIQDTVKITKEIHSMYNYMLRIIRKYQPNNTVVSLFEWYMNTLLIFIKSYKWGSVTHMPPLPSINGEQQVSVSKLSQYLQALKRTVAGLSMSLLMTTFRDVVEHFCGVHGIAIENAKSDNSELRFQIYLFSGISGTTVFGYISDDVLYVTSFLNATPDEYYPVSLEQLRTMVEQ